MSARVWLWVAAITASGCGETVETRVLHRSNCVVCHQPLNSAGEPEGIADPHPWHPLTCTDCHGGHAFVCDGRLGSDGVQATCDGEWLYDQDRAHPDPAGSPEVLDGLTPAQLDDVDPAYLRFVNPGDLRVTRDTCGRCHTAEAAAVRRSAHAIAAGELAVARLRAGKQATIAPRFGTQAVVDSNPTGGSCAAVSVAQMNPVPMSAGSTDPLSAVTVANAQDQLLVKSCLGCHIADFGANDAPGTYRSSGCTACHMTFAEDGQSRGGDPWTDKLTPPHAVDHRMSAATPTTTCTTCHHDGARIGMSFRGFRQRAGDDWESDDRGELGRALYGHAARELIADEDTRNGFDETPADVHFEAGMDCVDCHTRFEVHGDGHLYADAACAVRTRCEDCHGSVREAATTSPIRDNLTRGDDGQLYLETKVTGTVLLVPQVIDSVTPGHARFNAFAAEMKGLDANGFSHSDELECATCHAGWLPSCYGCHVEVDLTASAPYLTTGQPSPGRPTAEGMGVQTQDMVLMRNQRGKMAHSMPAERLFLTVSKRAADTNETGETEAVFAMKPRQATVAGRTFAAFGQRPIDPHTTRRRSPFMACDRCHAVGDTDAPDNAVLLDLTHGYGTDRFNVSACDVTNDADDCGPDDQRVYRLDALQTRDGDPLVVVGHDLPEPARPLNAEEIARMRGVLVPADPPLSTAIPAGAGTSRTWPAAQDLEAD